jgi:hypothetical protein
VAPLQPHRSRPDGQQGPPQGLRLSGESAVRKVRVRPAVSRITVRAWSGAAKAASADSAAKRMVCSGERKSSTISNMRSVNSSRKISTIDSSGERYRTEPSRLANALPMRATIGVVWIPRLVANFNTLVSDTPKLRFSIEAPTTVGMKRAMSPLKPGMSAHEVGRPSSIQLRATPAPSFSEKFSMIRTSEVAMPRSSRPTIPKSMSVACPSGVTNTLPGWGSAWKMRSTNVDR